MSFIKFVTPKKHQFFFKPLEIKLSLMSKFTDHRPQTTDRLAIIILQPHCWLFVFLNLILEKLKFFEVP